MTIVKKHFAVLLCMLMMASTLVACNDNHRSPPEGVIEAPTEMRTETPTEMRTETPPEKAPTDGLVFDLHPDGKSYKVSLYTGISTSVYIPSTYNSKPVTEIGDQAFMDCTWVKSVEIPTSVTLINSQAFEDCTSLTNVTIPESVRVIGWRAFAECESLLSIAIPKGVTTIETVTFIGCKSLKMVTIPSSVKEIGPLAFGTSTSLHRVTYLGTKDQWLSVKSYDNTFFADYTVYFSDGQSLFVDGPW